MRLALIVLTPMLLAGCFEEENNKREAGNTARDIPDLSKKVDRSFKGDRLQATSRPSEQSLTPNREAALRSVPESAPLSGFYRALIGLQLGVRSKPVTVLHIGDSHIAADRFTGTLRELFQTRFGDAGRGMMMPGFPFPYYQAKGVEFTRSGRWIAANSFKMDAGPYGVSGVRVTTREKGARLTLTSKEGAFEWAEVVFSTAPRGGQASVSFGGSEKSISTQGESPGVERVHIASKGRELAVAAKGNAPVSILSWSVGQNRPGIRYVNFGIPGATADTPRRWDEALVDSDLSKLSPDLIVLGYGTNEGFDDDLDMAAYEARVADLISRFKLRAPQASFLVLGPPDGLRFPRYARGKRRGALASATCRALSDAERGRYAELRKAKSPQLARWHAPPKLAAVRKSLHRVADREGARFWDWSQVMGGPCGIHSWANAKPPLAASDRVHLRTAGAKRSAHALFDELMKDYEIHVRLASR